jgi:hypothetical protein
MKKLCYIFEIFMMEFIKNGWMIFRKNIICHTQTRQKMIGPKNFCGIEAICSCGNLRRTA